MHTEDPMRKVLLNMTMTLDGFFCGPNGELDWMSQKPDQELNDTSHAKQWSLKGSNEKWQARTKQS